MEWLKTRPQAQYKEKITFHDVDEIPAGDEEQYFDGLVSFGYEKIIDTKEEASPIGGMESLKSTKVLLTYGRTQDDRQIIFKRGDMIIIGREHYKIEKVERQLAEKRVQFIAMNPNAEERFTLKKLYLK